MSMSLRADVARVVAGLVARRATPLHEIPELMASVIAAVGRLDAPQEIAPVEHEAAVEPVLREPRAPRLRRPRAAAAVPEAEPAPPPAPRLVRRAEVMPADGRDDSWVPFAVPAGAAVRGVVKWFDQRTRRGALRLPGSSGDVAIEPALLDEMAISRLYKGQEVDATLSTDAQPRVVRLALPGGVWQVAATGGVVRSRQAKPVVVELKRETMRRVGARAEAELLLGPGRR